MYNNGAQSWSDGSHPTYNQWSNTILTTPPPYCSLATTEPWSKEECDRRFSFICQFPSNRVNTSVLKLEYKKDELGFSAFQVWYKYRVATKSLLDAWGEKRMTGFKLSWKIENRTPPLEITTSKVGKSLTTPGFQDFYKDFHMDDQNFNASLLFPNDLPELAMGDRF